MPIKKKIITIAGARPQFIKLAALSPALRKKFNEVIVHTGQHYDQNLSDVFFKELNIPEPDYNLGIGNLSATLQIAAILQSIHPVIENEKPDGIIVFGDTNSTAAGSIAAAKHGIPLIHVEAGMREFDKKIPEESNKLITSVLADIHFCVTPKAIGWLKEMGITRSVYHTGDVMIDLCAKFYPETGEHHPVFKQFNLSPRKYVFATCHRAYNTDSKKHLEEILSALSSITIPVIFPVHPRTKNNINTWGLNNHLKSSPVIVCDPLPFKATQALIRNAQAVITDSGGVTKEAYYYQVQAILTDKQTEWVETVESGWNIQAGPNREKILSSYQNLTRPTNYSSILGNGNSSEEITEILSKLL